MDLRKATRGRKDTTITKTESAKGLEIREVWRKTWFENLKGYSFLICIIIIFIFNG